MASKSPFADDHVIQKFYERFLQVLHSHFPLENHADQVFVFHSEDKINKVVDWERQQIIKHFNKTLFDPKGSDCRHHCLRLRELGRRMQNSFLEFKAKNKEFQGKYETEAKEEINSTSENMRKSVLKRLILKPEMDIKDLEKLLETLKKRALDYFKENWDLGNNPDWFGEQRKMMTKKLEGVGMELVEMQKKHLEEKAQNFSSSNENDESGEMPNPPISEAMQVESTSKAIPPSMNEEKKQLQIHEGLPPAPEECSVDMTTSSTSSEPVAAPPSKSGGSDRDDNDEGRQMDLEVFKNGNAEVIVVSPAPVEENDKAASSSSESKAEVLKDTNDSQETNNCDDDKVEKMDLDLATENERIPDLTKRKIMELKSDDDDMEEELPLSSAKIKDMTLDSSGKEQIFEKDDSVVSVEAVATIAASNEENYPLVFRLASNRITVGTRIGEAFLKLHDPSGGELSLAPVIGIDSKRNLISGDQALKCVEHWWLLDFLQERVPSKKEISLKIGEEEVTSVLNLELLLGVILKSLKASAESLLGRTFTWAYITVPVWFCSPNRIQVRDGGLIAGFAEVFLLNQESLAAYAHAIRRPKQNSKCHILTLSETFGVLSAIVYEWSNRNLTMKHDFYWRTIPDSGKRIEVDTLCRSAHLEMGSRVKVALFLTESNEWLEAMMNGAEERGYEFSKDAPVSSSSDLFGASALCFPEFKDGRPTLREYPPPFTYPHKDDPFKPYVHMLGPKSLLPQIVECPIPFDVFKAMEKPRILQENHLHGNAVIVGELEYKKSTELLPNSNGLQLTFEITVDGVATLKEMKIRNPGKAGEMKLEDFLWRTPNMSGDEKEDMKKVVDSIQRGE